MQTSIKIRSGRSEPFYERLALQVLGIDNYRLRIRTTAVPTDGAANKMVSRLLAKYLSVAPSHVSLIRGHKHRDKLFLVSGRLVIPAELGALTHR